MSGKKSGGRKILPQTQSPGKGIPERFPKGPCPGSVMGCVWGRGEGEAGLRGPLGPLGSQRHSGLEVGGRPTRAGGLP